jgi:uncharacterized protein (TIGR03435 family)
MSKRVSPLLIVSLGALGAQPNDRFELASLTRPSEESSTPSGGIGAPDAQSYPMLPPGRQQVAARGSNGQMYLAVPRATIPDLRRSLEPSAGRPIVEETVVAGRHNFHMHFVHALAGDNAVSDEFAPSVFAAAEDQLGLRLASSRGVLKALIVESIDPEPEAN